MVTFLALRSLALAYLHTFQRVLIVLSLGKGFQGAVSPGACHSSVFIVLLPSNLLSLLSPSALPTLV